MEGGKPARDPGQALPSFPRSLVPPFPHSLIPSFLRSVVPSFRQWETTPGPRKLRRRSSQLPATAPTSPAAAAVAVATVML